jgi:alpha-tubulin suppressor-like RCC1 family protein
VRRSIRNVLLGAGVLSLLASLAMVVTIARADTANRLLFVWGADTGSVPTTIRESTAASPSNPFRYLKSLTAVSYGQRYGLAVKADGTAFAWGTNDAGQLGDGSKTYRVEAVQVSALQGVVAVSAGYNTSLALRHDGTVWAWGGTAGLLDGGPSAQRRSRSAGSAT